MSREASIVWISRLASVWHDGTPRQASRLPHLRRHLRLSLPRYVMLSTFSPLQAIIPEYLPGNPYSSLIQPVWCSYALGARPAVVISPDGNILYQQTWLQTGLVARALESFLAGEEVQSEDTNSSKTFRKPMSRNPSVIREGPRPSENGPGN